jgi:isoquinoline 1-oxidoreductase subunit beta
VQGSFDDFPLLRIDEAPRVEVHLVRGEGPPLGAGEMALPPVAAALGNAVFAATGRRIRKLPVARAALVA